MKISDYEVGFVAWGIGFVAGSAVVLATRGAKGPRLQVIAVVSALLGILLGKYLSFAFGAGIGARRIGLLSSDMFGFFRENLDVASALHPTLGRLAVDTPGGSRDRTSTRAPARSAGRRG